MAAIQRSAVCAFLGKSMAGGFAVGPKPGKLRHQLRAIVDDPTPLDLRLQTEHPRVAAPSTNCATAQVSDRLKKR